MNRVLPLVLLVGLGSTRLAPAQDTLPSRIEPADPDLIPEARAVLDYMRSIYGQKVITGINGRDNVQKVRRLTGKDAAILGLDLSGWNSPRWGPSYTPVVESTVREAKNWWAEGGIVTIQFHWKHPMKDLGTAWVGAHGKYPPSGPLDCVAASTPGTPEYEAFMTDLDRHADYLAQLAEARVPVLWRPFHEIDGGWFWWTDAEHPEGTAALWRQMFDHLVKKRGIHNLIWVYNAGLKPALKGKDVAQIEYRKRFYPGAAYVDIAGIDIYPSDFYGWEPAQESSWPRAFEIMSQVAPGKMLALSECGAIPSPDIMAQDGPKWLYALPWWADTAKNPADWVKTTYAHPLMITRDQLPKFTP